MTSEVSQPAVAIIILNWNNPSDTLACLCSVAALDYPVDRLTVIVVDNASSDDSIARIHASYPEVAVLKNSVNQGYAEGNNVGIRYALGLYVDYVVLLNNDTEVRTDFLSYLVAEAESDTAIGIVGPKMYFLAWFSK